MYIVWEIWKQYLLIRWHGRQKSHYARVSAHTVVVVERSVYTTVFCYGRWSYLRLFVASHCRSDAWAGCHSPEDLSVPICVSSCLRSSKGGQSKSLWLTVGMETAVFRNPLYWNVVGKRQRRLENRNDMWTRSVISQKWSTVPPRHDCRPDNQQMRDLEQRDNLSVRHRASHRASAMHFIRDCMARTKQIMTQDNKTKCGEM